MSLTAPIQKTCVVPVIILIISMISNGADAMFKDVTNTLLPPGTSQKNYGVAVTNIGEGDGPMEWIIAGFKGPNIVLQMDDQTGRYKNAAIKGSKYEDLMDVKGNAIGVCACDIDGDGKEEIYFLNTNNRYSGRKLVTDRLFIWRNNRYENLFADEVNKNVLSMFSGRSVACIDRTGNGKYGILLATYAEYGSGKFELIEMDEERSRGKNIVLHSIADSVGINFSTGGRGIVVGPILGEDGFSDIYFVNEGNRRLQNRADNAFFKNDGTGKFSNIAAQLNLDDFLSGRGITLADFNDDQLIDITYGNWDGPHKLFLQTKDQTGNPKFKNVANTAFYKTSYIRTVIATDFDNDGILEVFFNNIVYSGNASNRLYKVSPHGNDVKITTENIGDAQEEHEYGTGAAVADIDNDGVLELLISHGESASQALTLYHVMKSKTANNNFIRIMPTTQYGAPARGSRVTLTLNDGRKLTRIVDGGSGYLCQMEPTAHFGLGRSTPTNVKIQWPNGQQRSIPLTTNEMNKMHTVSFYGVVTTHESDRRGLQLSRRDSVSYNYGPESTQERNIDAEDSSSKVLRRNPVRRPHIGSNDGRRFRGNSINRNNQYRSQPSDSKRRFRVRQTSSNRRHGKTDRDRSTQKQRLIPSRSYSSVFEPLRTRSQKQKSNKTEHHGWHSARKESRSDRQSSSGTSRSTISRLSHSSKIGSNNPPTRHSSHQNTHSQRRHLSRAESHNPRTRSSSQKDSSSHNRSSSRAKSYNPQTRHSSQENTRSRSRYSSRAEYYNPQTRHSSQQDIRSQRKHSSRAESYNPQIRHSSREDTRSQNRHSFRIEPFSSQTKHYSQEDMRSHRRYSSKVESYNPQTRPSSQEDTRSHSSHSLEAESYNPETRPSAQEDKRSQRRHSPRAGSFNPQTRHSSREDTRSQRRHSISSRAESYKPQTRLSSQEDTRSHRRHSSRAESDNPKTRHSSQENTRSHNRHSSRTESYNPLTRTSSQNDTRFRRTHSSRAESYNPQTRPSSREDTRSQRRHSSRAESYNPQTRHSSQEDPRSQRRHSISPRAESYNPQMRTSSREGAFSQRRHSSRADPYDSQTRHYLREDTRSQRRHSSKPVSYYPQTRHSSWKDTRFHSRHSPRTEPHNSQTKYSSQASTRSHSRHSSQAAPYNPRTQTRYSSHEGTHSQRKHSSRAESYNPQTSHSQRKHLSEVEQYSSHIKHPSQYSGSHERNSTKVKPYVPHRRYTTEGGSQRNHPSYDTKTSHVTIEYTHSQQRHTSTVEPTKPQPQHSTRENLSPRRYHPTRIEPYNLQPRRPVGTHSSRTEQSNSQTRRSRHRAHESRQTKVEVNSSGQSRTPLEPNIKANRRATSTDYGRHGTRYRTRMSSYKVPKNSRHVSSLESSAFHHARYSAGSREKLGIYMDQRGVFAGTHTNRRLHSRPKPTIPVQTNHFSSQSLESTAFVDRERNRNNQRSRSSMTRISRYHEERNVH